MHHTVSAYTIMLSKDGSNKHYVLLRAMKFLVNDWDAENKMPIDSIRNFRGVKDTLYSPLLKTVASYTTNTDVATVDVTDGWCMCEINADGNYTFAAMKGSVKRQKLIWRKSFQGELEGTLGPESYEHLLGMQYSFQSEFFKFQVKCREIADYNRKNYGEFKNYYDNNASRIKDWMSISLSAGTMVVPSSVWVSSTFGQGLSKYIGLVGLDFFSSKFGFPLSSASTQDLAIKHFLENKPVTLDWGLQDDAMLIQRYSSKPIRETINEYKKTDGFSNAVGTVAQTISNFFGWVISRVK